MLFIIPDLLDRAALDKVRQLLGQSEFVDGRVSAGAGSNYQKNNLQAKPDDRNSLQARDIVAQKLTSHPMFNTLAVPRRVRPVTFNLYREGMYYKDHTDHSILPGNPPVRGDLSMTLFLSDPGSYQGGELVIHCDGPQKQQFKLPAGQAIVYDACTMHRVNTVTAGERLGAVTAIESLIHDATQRDIMGEVARLTRWVQDVAPQTEQERRASKIYVNLLRLWSQT